MVVSVLALAFLVLIGFIAIVGYKVIFQSRPQGGNDDREACAVCRERFDKSVLVMRQIGDYKLLYFCAGCIRKLHAEIPPGA
jgi:hypothetical protein